MQTQEAKILRPESVDVKADDRVHQTDNTSQEHSLDDIHDTLTKSRFDVTDLLEAAEDGAGKRDEEQ